MGEGPYRTRRGWNTLELERDITLTFSLFEESVSP